MAAYLELVDSSDGGFRLLLIDAEGVLLGRSIRFASLHEIGEKVALIREVAGTGLLRLGEPTGQSGERLPE